MRPIASNASGEEAALIEWVDWIDETGRTIQTLPRAEVRSRNLLHRVTATFVFHPGGRLFVHRRTETKDVYPGLYDVAVGGTVVSGESYERNACRELSEELGIDGAPLFVLFSHRFQDAWTNSLTRVFAAVAEGPFRLQPEEVAEGDWRQTSEIDALIGAARICPDSAQAWRLFGSWCEQHGELFAQLQSGSLTPVACSELR